MIGFSDFKNNVEIMKKYLIKMNTITECQIKSQWIDQKFLKQNNPQAFLQLLHYSLIKFSPFVVFVKILDLYPTIKDDSDKKFVTNAMIIARKLFQIDIKIDIDQFLSSKFVEKKAQFMSNLCKSTYQYHIRQNKQSGSSLISQNTKNKKQIQLKNNFQSKNQKYIGQSDQQDEAPRNFNIAPTNTRKAVPHIMKKQQASDSDQDLKELLKNKNKLKQKTLKTVQKQQQKEQIKQSSNILPKSLQKSSYKQVYPQQTQLISKKTIQKYPKLNQITQKPTQYNNQAQYQETQQVVHYVEREQFMQIIMGMNRNFTELLSKFNQFQGQVGGWVQNVNAKISILQQNVKTIKNNL